ncbi:phosphotransferase [Clostridium sp. MSJ-4]|uniref:Phosphotransferase n=1 Tax=Clostridium simiarum TaxID=2841506 RepID=A0ABS6F5B6_9CLOT|nr:phosphotransferase [Clostridium simiarum]MBU5592793.1 phosphotransferase [Clostridium simiarum]
MIENINIILDEVSKLYQLNIDIGNFNKVGNSNNLIYEFQYENEYFVLRITEKDIIHLPSYEAEVDFINYLAKNKVRVSKAISSINNKLVESIKFTNSFYIISIFEKADGHMPIMNSAEEWNSTLFHNCGQTMGQIHALSKEYKFNNKYMKRKQWNEDIYFTEEYSISIEDKKIFNKWNKIVSELNSLPKDKNSYGLIHYDFHQYNFFINKDNNLTVFDFDDCLYNWFLCDIAIAFYHAIGHKPVNEPEKRSNFAWDFIESFLKGYLKENTIDSYWIEKLPLFLEYRRICSYIFFTKMWDKQNIELKQKEYLKKIKYDIENEVPYIGMDFKILKEKLYTWS